jgi:hypothetical protein
MSAGDCTAQLPADFFVSGMLEFIRLSPTGMGFATLNGDESYNPTQDLPRSGVRRFDECGADGGANHARPACHSVNPGDTFHSGDASDPGHA